MASPFSTPDLPALLLVHRVCTPEVLAELERRVRDGWIHVGTLLVSRGVLDATQVERVLALQRRKPTRRFGDLVVELKLATLDAVESALEEQRERCPHLLELVLADARCDQARALEVLRVHVRQLEGTVAQFLGLVDPSPVDGG
ncbi:hypothetical protein Pla163_10460 [Planctomycetes bacterium Pla163]|uniref:Uncharacterized protein n=1 Tax=Rohdeia mirabilis TaxID=2528008 RepID=A0A518CXJ6_9BACT|nr:hypothetical protein Pla163_10460 [Planctomycetes bacterium Pla163]